MFKSPIHLLDYFEVWHNRKKLREKKVTVVISMCMYVNYSSSFIHN